MPSSAGAILLDRISLRERERGLVIGGTDSGKSTLSDQLGADWDRRYAGRNGRRLIVDSKPRYRAEWTARGRSAAPRYRRWSHGQPVPGSVVVDDPDELGLAWKMGARVVIVQRRDDAAKDIPRMVATVRKFLDSSAAARPQLAQFDETLDFFHGNGAPRGGDDVIVQIARAGRERGTAGLYCSQRTYGIPSTLMTELTKLYCFRVDAVRDAKRFQEMGAPAFAIPKEPHAFMYWTKRHYQDVWGPYRLNLGG